MPLSISPIFCRVASKAHLESLVLGLPVAIKFAISAYFEILIARSPALQSWRKYLEQTLVFMWNSTLREKISFFRSFLLVLPKFPFSKEDWAPSFDSMKFSDFPDISLFLRSQVLVTRQFVRQLAHLVLIVVIEKFDQTSKGLKTIWSWLQTSKFFVI